MQKQREKRKRLLSLLTMSAALALLLMMTTGCEDPAFDEPLEFDPPAEEPVMPEEFPGE